MENYNSVGAGARYESTKVREFTNIFLKEQVRKAPQLTCSCVNFMTLNSSIHQRLSIKEAIPKNSGIFTGKHPCQSISLTKLQA